MPITKDALQRLRAHYNEHKNRMPSQQKIADQAGLSESTVQRALSGQADNIKYETIARIAPVIGMNTDELGISEETVAALDNDDMRALVIALRDMNMRELERQREADDKRWRERIDADQKKYLDHIENLNKEHADDIRRTTLTHTEEIKRLHMLHVEEMKRISTEHADEIKRCNDKHEEHVTQIHKMYDNQMESMRNANSRQMELMLESHSKQLKAVQDIDKAQKESIQSMSKTQKEADEKSKDFLKGRIENLDRRSKVKDYIIFSLIFLIVFLFVIDFAIPNMGWIRRISKAMFSYNTFG